MEHFEHEHFVVIENMLRRFSFPVQIENVLALLYVQTTFAKNYARITCYLKVSLRTQEKGVVLYIFLVLH